MISIGDTLLHYKRPEIQKEIVESAKDREIATRFKEGFGERPDTLSYPQDILELTKAGARRALNLPVGGAFHSPLMEPAKEELEQAIDSTNFSEGSCPIYQNVTAKPITNPKEIKENLKKQLTAPVLWTQTMQQMIVGYQ